MIDMSKLQTNWSQPYGAQGKSTGQPTNPYGLPYDVNQYRSGTQNQSAQGGFQYPQQWGTANDIYNYFGTGGATATPWQWQSGSDFAQNMMQTGMPVTQGGWWDAAKQQAQGDITNAIARAIEQAGISGVKGTPMATTLTREIGNIMSPLATQWTGMELGAQEAARGRQMETLPQMYQFGAGTAGLTESAKNRAMQAAGGLQGLGQQYAQLPQDVAMNQMNLANMQQQMNMNAFSPYLQQWQYGLAENNPWLQYAMQQQQMPYGTTPQTYQPSFWTQAMNAQANTLPYLMMGG